MTLERRWNQSVETAPIYGLTRGKVKLEDPILQLAGAYDLRTYLDAELSRFNLSTNSVNTWHDYRGNRNVVGGGGSVRTYTSTQRPNSGTRTYRDKNVVDWDGATDTLFNAGISVDTRNSTMFWVGSCDTASTCIVYSSADGTGGAHFRLNSDGSIQTAKAGTSVLLSTSSVWTSGTPYIMAQRINSSQVIHYVNRIEYVGSNSTTFTNGRTLQLAMETASNAFDGWWGAFVYFGQDIGATNTYRVIDWLNSRWSIY